MGAAFQKTKLAVGNLFCHPAGVGGLDEVFGSGEKQDRSLDLLQTLSGKVRRIRQKGIELPLVDEAFPEGRIWQQGFNEGKHRTDHLRADADRQTKTVWQGIAAGGDDG